ncbi:hypothetical protein TRFO_07632 [Tritrichomonas foetus]|uniref:Uncharacterized protein n=1 Tax=Tritrichomonas foetus TaxID=1144522 RepID=A0A1J4JQR6_9EUKA|nr:hypothetical protein TRFO_07632 [Tritrichomonas foetus]|eukprot:OHT01379.1 hypothetical protein TRFO_07632 [Tritrichomonas foetus]
MEMSKWSKIIIINKNTKGTICEYKLDEKCRLTTKMKRQSRRDLGKMTGKRGIPRNKKRAMKKLEEMFPTDHLFYNPHSDEMKNSNDILEMSNINEINNIQEIKIMTPLNFPNSLLVEPIVKNNVECNNRNFHSDYASLSMLLNPIRNSSSESESSAINHSMSESEIIEEVQYLSSIEWLLNTPVNV